MPFNGSGGFVPVAGPDYPPVASQPIYASQFIANITDVHSGLANCVTRDGQSPATANLPMGGFRLTNLAVGAAVNQALTYDQTGARLASLRLTDGQPLQWEAGDVRLLGNSATDVLEAYTTNVKRLQIGAAGDVGIAVDANTGYRLQVYKAGASAAIRLHADTGFQSLFVLATNAVDVATFGLAGAADAIITGASIGDVCLRTAAGDVLFSGNGGSAVGLGVDSVNRIFGTALHNNASSPTGTARQYVASGTYTPTGTIVANIDTLTPRSAQWLRVGNVVTVSGAVDIDPTTTGSTTFGLSLPLASDLALYNLGGAGAETTGSFMMAINADVANNRANFQYTSPDTLADGFTYSYTYLVA